MPQDPCMPLQLLTLSPGDAHRATRSSESAGGTSTGGGGSTGPRVLGYGSSSCNLCQPWQQVQCSSNCINPVYENIPEKRAEQLPTKATCLQRKFKSRRKGLVVAPFYITQSFCYKQLPDDWWSDWVQPWKLSPWGCARCASVSWVMDSFFRHSQLWVVICYLCLKPTKKGTPQNMDFKQHGTSRYALVCSDFGRE